MKLETTWNEHGKIWHYFTTSREAQAARVEGVVFKAAVGLLRSIAAYACSRAERKQILTHQSKTNSHAET